MAIKGNQITVLFKDKNGNTDKLVFQDEFRQYYDLSFWTKKKKNVSDIDLLRSALFKLNIFFSQSSGPFFSTNDKKIFKFDDINIEEIKTKLIDIEVKQEQRHYDRGYF